MAFGHENLNVYKGAIQYVAWAYRLCEDLPQGHRHAKDQLLRASQSIPLNIAEGNGKASQADRRRYFESARGSSFECAAAQDVLEACDAISLEASMEGKRLLDRMAAMLTRLGQRGYSVHESGEDYAPAGARHHTECDSDTDSDTDAWDDATVYPRAMTSQPPIPQQENAP